MVNIYTEGKIKPAVQDGKVADFSDIDGQVTVDQVVAALRDGSIILPDETTGNLPDPSMNQGRFALTDSGVALSRNHSVDAVVTFKLFGPDRVVAAGEAAISSKEMLYRGVVLNTVNPPPVADADVGAYYWSISGQVWLHKSSSIQSAWQESNHPGAPLVFNSFIYGTEAEAANHVHGVGNWQPNGRSVAIIGHGNSQLAYVLTAYTAPVTDNWQWDPLGLTQADIQAHIAQHNTATDAHDDIRTEIDTDVSAHDSSGTAHNSIRSLISANSDRLDALNALEIEPYDSTATYSRGSANSIVTHSNGLFIYISATERSSGHDPDTQPGYWLELNEGVAYMVISSGSHRIAARTLIVDGATDQVYLCTTTQTTPRDLTYIKAQADIIGGTFIELTAMIATTWRGPHVIGTTYEAGDRVTTNANSRIYTARVDTDETPPHADWIQIGPVGSGGGSDLAVQEEGTEVASAATTLNFTGTGATATASGGTVTVDIPGGQAGSLDDGSVTTAKLADGAVTTPKLADDAVTGDKIADNTIHGGALIDGTIPTGKIGDDQVTGAKLSDNAVSTGKVADDAITQAKIADDAVDTDQIADEAVTQTKLGEFSVVTGKIANNQITTAKLADDAVTTAKLADNAAGEGKIPIDNTLQFDGSGNLGVEISTVIDLLDEDIRYYSTDTTREDARQASKGIVFLDISRYARRIHSVEWDFEGDGVGHNYTTFFVRIDSNDDIDFVYGESETLFNVGTSGTRRFNFGSNGLRIPGGVERLGLFLTRTGSDDTWETKVYRGQPASDSPRESYPDASVDFPFWRSARFASGRPEPGEHIDNYITNGEIYGYPKIRYTLELEHASLVGDGNIEVSHIDSGSSADGTVLTADGSGGVAFEDLPSVESEIRSLVEDFAETGNSAKVPAAKVPGSLTHRQAQAVTVSGGTLTIPTEDSVQGGDTVLFVIPTPWTATGNLTVRVTQGGVVQANTTLALNDRVGNRLTGSDVVAEEEMEIILATDWRSLVHPTGTGTGTTVTANPSGTDGDDLTRLSIGGTNYNIAGGGGPLAPAYDSTALYELGGSNSLVTFQNQLYFYSSSVSRSSNHSPETHPDYWIDLSTVSNYISLNETDSVRIPGGTFVILPHDNSVYLSRDDVDATAERNAAWVRSHAGPDEQFIQVSVGISWGFQIDTLIVPELNQDAITDARIVLEDSALTHYLAFLDWTAANLALISHLPVGGHIGLRQGTTIRILRVAAVWDETNNRYQVTNVNAGGLLEAASGTATELLLTAGAGGGTAVEANPTGTDGDDLTRIAIGGTNYNVPSGGSATGFTELRAPATLSVAQTWTATGATIPAADGDEWVRMNGNFDGEVPENFEFLSSRLRSLAEHLVGGSTTTGDVERLQFHDGSVFQRVFLAQTAAGELIMRHESATQALGNLSVYSYSAIAGDGDLKGQRIASITFGATPTSGSSLETSASGSGTRLDSGDIGGTGSDVGWVRDSGAPTAFTVERIGASSDEPVINVPQTRATANAFGYLVELEILPQLGTLSNAISAVATSIIFSAESIEVIAVGDDLRIESEVVTVDAVPADGATGVAARTYGVVRGQDGTTAATHTNTRMVQKTVYELESDGIILQGGPSPQQGGSSSRSTVSLGTGGLQDATGIRELGVRLSSTRSTTGLSGLEQVRLIDLISQGDNAVLLPSTRITVYLAVIDGAAAASGGQESPGNEGVAALTPDLVTVTLYKWVLTTDGKPADPTAHWRFDDEWDGTTPFQGGGWYVSRSTALDEADNNPAFSQDTWTLWIATEQVRRRVVNEAYSYTDGGYTVTGAWDIQYSIDGMTWTVTEPTDTYHYIRYRDQETGQFGPTIPIGTDVGSNDWQPIRTNDLVYPAGANVDELGAAYDFGNFSELLFIVSGYRSVSVDDGLGGTIIVGVNGPWHSFVLNRGGGWPVADISEGEDNNDADDGSCFQFTYFATNTGVGLQIWERGDDYVDPSNPPFLQDDGEPPRQLGGHFKIVSTDGDEAHVTKFRFFAFSHQFARTTMSIFARYR